MKIEAKYQYFNHNINKVENVNIVLNEKIDLYLNAFDDDADYETIEDVKGEFLSFMISVREQMNILLDAVSDLDELNKTMILGNSVDISSIEYKKEMLKHRY